MLLRDGWPPMNLSVGGERMVWREQARFAPKWTARVGLNVAFPQWRPW